MLTINSQNSSVIRKSEFLHCILHWLSSASLLDHCMCKCLVWCIGRVASTGAFVCRDDDDDKSDNSDENDTFAITGRQKELQRRKMQETILAAAEGRYSLFKVIST